MDHALLNLITTFIFDVDGVFTNGEVIVMENGDFIRTMHTRDGQALVLALEAGYNIAIITKGRSEGVRKRFEILGIKHIYDNVAQKTDAFFDFKSKLSLKNEEILYFGDDIPDLSVYPHAGISVSPSDGAIENLQKAMYITSKKGGHGCVREIIEKVMRQQGKWNF